MFDFLKRFATPAQLREAGVLGMNRRNYEIIAKSNRPKSWRPASASIRRI